MDLVIRIAGGVGLLLLGMKLMTDGLKLAGGHVLRRVLRTWTKSGLRGIMSGFFITSLVQSSGAVTVAAIGFVNAGIMSLGQAVWVVYGSNIGTTTTAWIVALMGFEVNIKAFALPLVALGTGLWLSGGVTRKSAVGEALAGFGVFFLGVEMLQAVFPEAGGGFIQQAALFQGILGQLLFLGIGFGLTFIMQSSSASMALILTAAAGGLPMPTAAAAVIGANLGSTSTAAIAVIGATPNAKRLAAIHVAFNLLTGCVAFGLVRVLLLAIDQARLAMGLSHDPASELALFHTVFNVLGVLLMWPVTRRLTRWVERRFRTLEEDEGTPRFLDNTVVRTPALAANALIMEAGRVTSVSRRMALNALECRSAACRTMGVDMAILERLRAAVADFAAKVSREGLSRDVADALPHILRVVQYAAAAAAMAQDVAGYVGEAGQVGRLIAAGAARADEGRAKRAKQAGEQSEAGAEPAMDPLTELAQDMEALLGIAATILTNADAESESFAPARLGLLLDSFERAYQALKELLLEAGSRGVLDSETMVALLERFSHIRRMVEQLEKGARLLFSLRQARILRGMAEPAAVDPAAAPSMP